MVCTSKWISALRVMTCCSLIALPAVGQKTGSAPPPPQPLPVIVQNSAGQPVPTAAQGTTNVAGTVNIGNTPAVTLSGEAAVTNPLNLNNQPVPLMTTEGTKQYEDTCSFAFNGNGGGFCLFHPLPSGKKLVVEEFDAAPGTPPDGLEVGCKPIVVSLNVTSAVKHFFPATFMGSRDGHDYFATTEKIRAYGDASTTPSCSINLTCFSNQGYSCQIAGFLVDIN